jgi:hypothetical protein
MNECDFPGSIGQGARGRNARRVQEWLCLHDWNVVIDGDFGPATKAAVQSFQSSTGLTASGTVNQNTWAALVQPMTDAVAELDPQGRGVGDLAVAYARQHLAQHPREVGGQNRGPWVRLYMKGNDGAEWAWCAGFVCYLLRQAARTLGIATPLAYTFSCDSLAAEAKQGGLFQDGRKGVTPDQLTPGSLFLLRRSALDWTHTGMVVSAAAETFDTIEGNTNDSGEREGYEVCKRVRGYEDKDFAVIGLA